MIRIRSSMTVSAGLRKPGLSATRTCVIHTLLLSTGVSGAGPMLAIISRILDRSVAGWGQLSAFDAVRIKTFLREQGSVL